MNQKLKILIVDDDCVANLALKTNVEAVGYEAKTLENGQEAWKHLTTHNHEYAAIIVDRMMMGIDGMELLRRIKAHKSLSHLPVIMQTGEAETEAHINALKAGVFDFLYKPIEQDLLRPLLRRALGGSQSF